MRGSIATAWEAGIGRAPSISDARSPRRWCSRGSAAPKKIGNPDRKTARQGKPVDVDTADDLLVVFYVEPQEKPVATLSGKPLEDGTEAATRIAPGGAQGQDQRGRALCQTLAHHLPMLRPQRKASRHSGSRPATSSSCITLGRAKAHRLTTTAGELISEPGWRAALGTSGGGGACEQVARGGRLLALIPSRRCAVLKPGRP